jgi:hypothetical protein
MLPILTMAGGYANVYSAYVKNKNKQKQKKKTLTIQKY